MTNAKFAGRIRDILGEYGDLPMISDDNVPLNALYVLGPDEAGGFTLRGSVVNINRARDIRNNIYVPEIYDDEASTWA